MDPDYGTTYVFPDPVNGYASRCEFPILVQDEGKGVGIALRTDASSPPHQGCAASRS